MHSCFSKYPHWKTPLSHQSVILISNFFLLFPRGHSLHIRGMHIKSAEYAWCCRNLSPKHIMNFEWKLAMNSVEFILVERMVKLGLKRKPAINHILSVLSCPAQHLESVILLWSFSISPVIWSPCDCATHIFSWQLASAPYHEKTKQAPSVFYSSPGTHKYNPFTQRSRNTAASKKVLYTALVFFGFFLGFLH